MLLDGFTVVAQMINFIILVVVLKTFLYKPITTVMIQRKAQIQQQLDQAAAQMEQAQQEKLHFQQKQHGLDQHRAELLANIQADIDTYKHQLLAEAKADVEATRQKWQQGLIEEQRRLAQTMQHHIGRVLTQTVQDILVDLTNSQMEYQLAAVFLDQLHHLPKADRCRIQATLAHSVNPSATVTTSFALPPELRQTLTQQIQLHLGAAISIQFHQVEQEACSIELQIAGYRLSWGLAPYVAALQTQLKRALETSLNYPN